MLIIVICVLDAKIMGMEEDLNLEGYDFNIALTCFFITYVLFEM